MHNQIMLNGKLHVSTLFYHYPLIETPRWHSKLKVQSMCCICAVSRTVMARAQPETHVSLLAEFYAQQRLAFASLMLDSATAARPAYLQAIPPDVVWLICEHIGNPCMAHAPRCGIAKTLGMCCACADLRKDGERQVFYIDTIGDIMKPLTPRLRRSAYCPGCRSRLCMA